MNNRRLRKNQSKGRGCSEAELGRVTSAYDVLRLTLQIDHVSKTLVADLVLEEMLSVGRQVWFLRDCQVVDITDFQGFFS
jgi:hypothetical protein